MWVSRRNYSAVQLTTSMKAKAQSQAQW